MSHSSTTLTNEELVSLVQRGENVNDNLQLLYDRNRGMIYQHCKAYLIDRQDIDDLMQEAFIGLYEAVNRYDPEAGSSFITYAGFWIKQRLSRYCKSNMAVKRIPDHMVQRIRQYKKYLAAYYSENGKYPNNAAVCSELSISSDQLDDIQRFIHEADIVSLDDIIPGTDIKVEDTIADDIDLEDLITQKIDNEILWRIVASLGNPKGDIVIKYYKLNHTIKQLSEEYGQSANRVSQIKNDALRVLAKKKSIKDLARHRGYLGSEIYAGTLTSFKNSGESVVERAAIRNIQREEHRQQLMNELSRIKLSYKLGDTDE